MIKQLSLPWQFAKRFYQGAYQNGYIRFINSASRAGISLGVAALIIGLSIMNGFERELKNTLLAVIPDIEYQAVTDYIDDWPKTVSEVNSHPNVIASAPYIKLNAMVQQGQQLHATLVNGVDATLEKQVNGISDFMIAGNWFSDKGVIVGSGLAATLNVQLGDAIELLLPGGGASYSLTAPKYVKTTIVGIYQVGGQMDYGQVFMPLSQLQQLFNLTSDQAHGVKVALDDPFSARTLASNIAGSVSAYVYILDWFRAHGHVYRDIVMVKNIMYLVMVLVICVACFNIVSSLTMAVQEKHGDIGILKTMGLTNKRITQTFVFMGMFTAVRGVIWGIIFGCLGAIYLPDIVQYLEQAWNFKALDKDVYFIDHLPSELQGLQVTLIAATAFVISLFACFIPAKKASKLTPVELLNSH